MNFIKLLRLPTEAELELYSIEFESFYQYFINNQGEKPFTSKVKIDKDGNIVLGGYLMPPSDWFEIIQ